MDTKYFAQAVENYCKKHRFEINTPFTMAQLSEVLKDAQKLKDEDRERTNAGGAA